MPQTTTAVIPAITNRSEIDALLKTFDRPTEPGCAVGVYENGAIKYSKAFGLADLDAERPNTPATSINIGSIGKQFTASGILLLAQEGKLSLDDDVRKHVPELPDLGHTITIRRLLTHTSGIRDQRGLLNLAGHKNSDVVPARRILETLALQRGLNFPPGDQVMYSNAGYFLAGVIIERTSGLPFQTFMRTRVFQPLGMTQTRFKGDLSGMAALAKHYSPGRAGQFESNYERWEEIGTGDLYSSIEDLARWDANFRTGELGGTALVEAMQERGRLNDGRNGDYALGLKHGAMHGYKVIGHTGRSEGSVSSYQRFVETGLSVVTLCNRTDGPADEITSEVAKLILPERKAGERVSITASYVGLPSAPIKTWIGTYSAPGNPMVVKVRAENGLIMELGGGKFPLRPVGGDAYEIIGAPADTFAKFEKPSGDQPRRLVPLNSDDEPMLAFDGWQPTSSQLRELEGYYDCPELGTIIGFREVGGKLTALIPPTPAQIMQPRGLNELTLDRVVFNFRPSADGRSKPEVRIDQWRARGMRCERRSR